MIQKSQLKLKFGFLHHALELYKNLQYCYSRISWNWKCYHETVTWILLTHNFKFHLQKLKASANKELILQFGFSFLPVHYGP